MLTTIDTTVRFRILVPLTSRRSDEYIRGLKAILRHYNKGGFFVHQINCDGEYTSIMDEVKDKLNITMNYANPGDHVPEAERNNRTIKERIRAAFHCLDGATVMHCFFGCSCVCLFCWLLCVCVCVCVCLLVDLSPGS